jgi:hypothetical protein
MGRHPRNLGFAPHARVTRIIAGATLVVGALAGLGLHAVPAQASTVTTYSGNVNAAGLNLDLFGNKLTGGNSLACFNHGLTTNKDNNGNATACDGKASTFAAASGEGTFLTAAGLHALAGAHEATVGQSMSQGSDTNPVCSPVATGGPQGSSGVTIDGAISCAWARAVIDGIGNPSATGYGELAHLNVDLNGILGQITGASPSSSNCTQSAGQMIGALLGGACTLVSGLTPLLGSATTSGVNQALQDLYDVTTSGQPANTVTIAVAPAKSSVATGVDGTVSENAYGATLDLNLLPGVGCKAGVSLATCAANEVAHLTNEASNPTGAPLVELQVGPARCSAARDATGKWTSTDYSSIVDLDVNIPGANLLIHLPGDSGTGTYNQTILQGSPLQSTIRIASGSSAPVGDSAACAADSLTLSLLENSMFPGGTTTVGSGGAIVVTAGSSTMSAGNSSSSTPTSPGGGNGGGTGSTSAANATPTAAVVTSPTSIHTGEWWSGSMPLLVVVAAIGAGLLGWPRLRRTSLVSRLVKRAGR